MRQSSHVVGVRTSRGLTEITTQVDDLVRSAGVREGLCTVFIRHTSASLVIQENADPSVQTDLEAFMQRLVPDGDRLFTHVLEGDDDMPAHAKAALLPTTLSIPIRDGRMALGTWQGVYVFEHRRGRQRREAVIHILGE